MRVKYKALWNWGGYALQFNKARYVYAKLHDEYTELVNRLPYKRQKMKFYENEKNKFEFQ